MAVTAKITDEQVLAELLRLHNIARWPNTPLGLRTDTPMRRELRKRGLIECKQRGPMLRAFHWYMTSAGRELLINVPGSGITRPAPL